MSIRCTANTSTKFFSGYNMYILLLLSYSNTSTSLYYRGDLSSYQFKRALHMYIQSKKKSQKFLQKCEKNANLSNIYI